jgi:hypothetical protein
MAAAFISLNGFASRIVSFTLGFSPVLSKRHWQKTVSTVSQPYECLSTGLKPGVNEKDY